MNVKITNQYNKDKICLIRIFCLFIYKQLKYFYYALNILFRAFLMKTIDNRKMIKRNF